ncbi:RidA family protein [Paenibacillus hodogayensis]|uniref:RidA family protein n=1 Tax=Paenibacillus hodogayensis TaxID=279208 RepID=A0ABV5VR14_9BACL
MGKRIVTTDKAPAPGGAYSQAVIHGNTVYVAGTCPFELGTGKVLYPDDVVEQTRLVLHYMGEILRAAGSSIEHVVKVTSFLRNLDDFKAYDRVYAETFAHEPPARSTVEIGKFPPGMTVEIECVALIP